MSKITAALGDDDTITFTLPAKSGDGEDTYTIEAPTPEQILLLATADSPTAGAMELLSQVFEPTDYKEIRRRLGLRKSDPARLTMDDLIQFVTTVVEARASFPTTPPSDSSTSPTPIGTRSTGRVRSAASTPSASDSAAS